MEKFQRFFGLKSRNLPEWNWNRAYRSQIVELFPDTTVGVLKECFEALQLYDLAELLEKVRPRSLRPALSLEQIEQLRGSSDRPTKYHSNVAVLVVKQIVGGLDNVASDNAEKIEAFFKDLNSRNEVTIIASPPGLQAVRKMEKQLKLQEEEKKRMRHRLEIEIPQERESLEKEMQEQKEGKKTRFGIPPQDLSSQLEGIQQYEVRKRRELERFEKKVAVLRKQRETIFKPQIEELQKEIEKAKTAISTAMDKWIHNQDKFTCFAVFVISDDKWSTEAMLEECIMEKLALIPDHAKLVVTPSEWKTIGTVPETLHVMCNLNYLTYKFYPLMIEIFNKRRETLDLVSMMQELGRTLFGRGIHLTKDTLSTLLRFQKTEEKRFRISGS
ncbi:hypothetical protein OS493_025296 [Desmophyllum pertusum]|uniref:Uncharacterized protein n=1 Tax=Desmophyllum pertusum TaxID=174260 RepID=A0A9W9ZAW0_9CNID|nr:hypothetical protein OS493_025296 [Desmophyllum pertusum]